MSLRSLLALFLALPLVLLAACSDNSAFVQCDECQTLSDFICTL